jgi:hypothetical protein
LKKILALGALAALLATPVLAQSNDTNLKPGSDVVKGAEKSAEPGMAAPGGTPDMKNSGSDTNSGNLQSTKDVVKDSKEGAMSNGMAPAAPVTPSTKAGGSDTNSGNLKQP